MNDEHERERTPPPGLVFPGQQVARAVRALIDTIGEAETSKRLQVSGPAVQRLAADSSVKRGTLLSAQLALGLIKSFPADAAGLVVE